MARQYQLTAADVQAIANTSARLGIQPADLAAVIHYETIGTMNPTIKGGKGGNYQGLIQFGPRERRAYGYNADASFAEQVEGPVYRYLKDRGLQPGMDLGRIYRTVNGGNPNAKLTANDGNGTIAQHIERIKSQSLPRAQAILQAAPPANIDAIMDVASLNQAPSAVPDQPTAAQGYAPDLGSSAPAQTAITDLLTSPPQTPPQWASATGFPIDESLTGASAQETLAGGPRMDPRRAGPATGFMPPDMGAMRSPADVLNAGPNLRPPIEVPMPVPPPRPTGPGIFQRNAVSGAPDAGTVPTPPPRAQGIPDPRMRPPPAPPPMVAGRPEFPGALPGAPRSGDLSATMGNAPPRRPLSPPTPEITPEFIASLGRAEDMNRTREDTEFWTGDLQPQASPPWGPTVAGRPEFPGGGMPPAQGPFFDEASPGLSLPPQWASGSFPPPPSPIGTVGAGSTGGEFFTPAPPMPSPPPDPLASRFDDAFAPGGGGQIMDLQSAFNKQNAPPTMTAQDGIDNVFGAPPAAAQPPNLAIPFAEVPGFDMGRFAGASPAAAATVASPLPQPISPPGISQADFDARFAGGSVVQPPTPGITPGVVSGEMPQAGASMDIRPPAQGGPAFIPPAPEPPRMTPPAERGNKGMGIAARILGGLLGGPIGAIGGGLLGGGGGGFGFGGSAAFNPIMGSGGTAPFNMQPNGQTGQTNYVHGNAGNMQGTMWNKSNGGSVGYVTDPFTGAMIYSASPTGF